MAHEELSTLLGGWEGFTIVAVRREPVSATQPVPRVVIELAAVPTRPKRCGRCDAEVATVHEVTLRRVRDLPLMDAETWIEFPRARVECPRCGPTVEAVPWLDRYQRMTTRLAAAIARLAQVLPIKHVAQWFAVGGETVKQIDPRALVGRLGPIDLTDVRVIAIDEFAIHRGHRYATVVANPVTRKVLWVGRGRAREDLRPFFALLGPDGCARPEAAVMDMSGAYADGGRAQCPHAAIVYDLFHAVAKYGREVVDRVRVDETNRLAGRAHGRGPGAVHGLRAQGRPEAALALSLPGRRAALPGPLASARPGESPRAAPRLRTAAHAIPGGDLQPLSPPLPHQRAGRDQQQDQGPQAHGLRVSR